MTGKEGLQGLLHNLFSFWRNKRSASLAKVPGLYLSVDGSIELPVPQFF